MTDTFFTDHPEVVRYILKHERRTALTDIPTFTENEAMLLLDALNGVICMPETLEANVREAIRWEHLDEKWQVDGPALLSHLQGLSMDEAQAVMFAVRRAWGVDYHVPDLRQRARDAGLVQQSN